MASPAAIIPPSASVAAAVSAASGVIVTPAVEAAVDAPIDEKQLQQAIVAGQQQHQHGGAAAAADELSRNFQILCKWKTQSYTLTLPQESTVGFMKMSIALLTNVRPHHQKLILAGAKAKLQDDAELRALGLKPGSTNKLMLIGNPEDQLVMDDEDKAAALEPVDDLDYDYRPSELLALQEDPAIRAKVEKYWTRVKDTFTLISPIRPNKRLLVIDIDYTIYDMKGASQDWTVLKRPGTHRFLAACHEHYELVFWSQTNWRFVELKLTELGVLMHPDYKVAFTMDKTSMFSIHSPDPHSSTGALRKHHVKCLELIWRRFPQWNATNTVHIDDLGRNFALNPQSGLRIAPYKNSHETRRTDRELPHLQEYLVHIAQTHADFTKIDHSKWKSVVPAPPPRNNQAAAASNNNPR